MSFKALEIMESIPHIQGSWRVLCIEIWQFDLTLRLSFSVSLVRAKTLVQIRGIPSLPSTPLLTDLSGKTLGTDGYSCSHQACLRVSRSKSYFVLFFRVFKHKFKVTGFSAITFFFNECRFITSKPREQ